MKLFLTLFYAFTLTVLTSKTHASGGSFAKITTSFRPEEVDLASSLKMKEEKAYAWRGERLNFQIILWADNTDLTAKAHAKSLHNKDGDVIPASSISLNFLKFIEMHKLDRYATSPENIERVPDMFNGSDPVTVKAGQVQPLWVSINIPQNAKPGVYRTGVAVKLGSKELQFPIAIKVLPLTVPAVKDWNFKVNYWTHPQATLHYYLGCTCHGEDTSKYVHKDCEKQMWSDAHLALYKPTLELLRDAGLRSITVNLTKDPWLSAYKLKSEQHQTNYPYDEMIHWRKKADGSFTFDFSDFEKYVKFCMDLGVDQKIECFSMLPWVKGKFSAVSCYDEATQKQTLYHFKSWEEYDQVWSAFMSKFVPVLVRNGWFEKTVMGVDERGLHNMGRVQNVLKKFTHKGKPLRISAAANKTHSFDDSLYHISMHGGYTNIANNKWTEEQFAKWAESRRKKGLMSTWYTCTGTFPGNFGNSSPAESLFIGYYSARLAADGYLRWAVDSWNDNPTETTDHKVYETGDTFQLYPGPRGAKTPITRSSVRFELFRQGIVNYEKIQVLRAKSSKTERAIEAMLADVTRPARPAPYKGQSSLQYDKSNREDFTKVTEKAEQALLKISLDVTR